MDFSVRKVVRVDPKLDFDWGTGAPATGVSTDTFSIRWEGQIQPLKPALQPDSEKYHRWDLHLTD